MRLLPRFSPHLALVSGLVLMATAAELARAVCPIRPNPFSTDYGFGSAVVLPGDLNGDGADDFVIGAAPWIAVPSVPGRVHIFFGGPLVDETSDVVLDGQTLGDQFGRAVASAGDLNADGHVDLVVGAYQNDANGSNSGRAYVYFGGPALDATADLVLSGEAAGDEFGIAVAGIGDANGDGYDDLLVGARNHRVTTFGDGRAYVYFGGPGLDAVPDAVLDGQGGERLGNTVSRFDDVNGDGRTEFVVGAAHGTSATNQTLAGRAYVYSFGAGGGISAVTLYGNQTGAYFSDGLGSGDVDGDGHPDLLIGASGADAQSGRLFVCSGGPGFDTVPDLEIPAPGPYQAFGLSVAGGADVDADGYGDLIVGAPYGDGHVYLFAGGPALDAVPEADFTGESPLEHYGWSVAAAVGSDVNGDGEDDVLASAPSSGTNGRGRADFPVATCVTVTCPGPSTVPTGQTFDLQYAISNCEGTSLDLEYTITNSDAWCSTVTDAVSLAPGASVPAVVTCTAPAVCNRTTSFVLTVRLAGCPATPVRTCSVSVTTTHDASKPVIECVPAVEAEPGATVSVAFTVHNPSAFDQSYRYTFSSPRWCNTWILTVDVPAGDSVEVAKSCTVPSNATAGDSTIVEFSAYNVCSSGSPSDIVECQTVIRVGTSVPPPPPEVCVNLICPPDTVIVPGEVFERRLRIANCGTATGTFDYVVVDDQGWGQTLSGSLTIPGLAAASIVASFAAPAGTSCMTMDVLRFVVHPHGSSNPVYSCSSLMHAAPSPNALVSLQLSGPTTESGFGVSTAMPGDLNADGHEDFVVGATTSATEGATFPGRAYVYFGGPAADTTPDVVLSGEVAGDRFGYAVARAGDLNSDGHPDLAVGAYQFGSSAGRVYAYFGGPGFDAVPDFTVGGQLAGEQFGIAVDGAGDVNADGHDDLLVGARLASAAGANAGRAYVFFGGPNLVTTPPLVLEGHAAGERLGFTVAGARDLNGDTRADLLVGADYYSGPGGPYQGGRVYAYYGGPSLDATADLVLSGAYEYGHFGVGLAAADVNGDAYADILAGATGTGRVEVYFGGPAINGQSDLVIAPGIVGDSFGRFISAGADLDGDGFGDFVVGAPGGGGRVHFYLGGPGLDTQCDGAFVGEVAGDQFGSSGAATGADLNGDGAEDVLLGAYQNPASTAKPNAVLPGRAYYYSGLYAIPVAVPDGSAAWEDGALSLDVPFETTAGVRISYRVGPAASRVVVDVHDIAGRRVRHFEEGLRGPGAHAVDWDKRDERGVRVSRSVYIVRLTADATSLTRKVVVLRP